MPEMKFEIERHITGFPIVRLPCLDSAVGNSTLAQLRGLRTVELPTGLEVIGEGWFMDSGVEEVTVPESVREIGKYVFACCKNLRLINFAEDSRLEKIGYYCFYDSGIQRIAVPSGIKVIERGMFQSCFALTSVTF